MADCGLGEEVGPVTVLGDLVGVGDFEVAGGGLDADHVVTLFPAMQRQDRASAEWNDSDAGPTAL
jgi:hypothetical protein